ncbi:YceI family protein [Chitinophaga sedimenti]|nr:YceI family protein [Chitinophaga sedimenti]MCK7559925.1 YceI family protein [Chitinophaga sedimenti]
MKQILLMLFACSQLQLAGQPVKTWKLDRVHSSVKFAVTHMLISEVEGKFSTFDGSLKSARPDFTDAVIHFTVDVLSIDTDDDNRDKHLKSADFLTRKIIRRCSLRAQSLQSRTTTDICSRAT